MKRVGAAIAMAVGLAAAWHAPAFAATPGLSPAADAALRALRAEAGSPVRASRHAGTSRIRTLKGRLSPPREGSPEEAASRFLSERGALFGLAENAGDLRLDAVRASPAGHHLAYRQTSSGLPVFNGGIEVNLDRELSVFLVNNHYVRADGLAAAVFIPAAAAVASAERGLPALPPFGAAALVGEPELGVFLDGETPRLAWRFVLARSGPFAVVEFMVDARTGGVLEQRSLVQEVYRNGWGRVFNPNPVNTLKNTALKDNADADSALFTPAYRKVQLRSLSYLGTTGQYQLRGPYVNVSDAKEGPLLFKSTGGVISSRTGSFLFGRTPDQFEHVMCYFHIDANQRYIQGLGFLSANRRSVKVDPHGLAGADSSRYVASPVGAGYLAYGIGQVDDAEDADVILHEYAHAVQDNQARGKYLGSASEAGAMGEGFADYWAASSTYDRSLASGFDPLCVGEWNRAPGCMDRVDSTKHYPEDKVGAAQPDGQIWSAALWDLFAATGDRGATDTIVLQSHYLVPASPTFSDGVEALIAADEALYGGRHLGEICSVMSNRGILTDGCALWATLSWDNAAVDLDLRLRPPDGQDEAGWDYANDCFSGNSHPDWGVAQDAADDPLLRRDCRYGCTEEQIALGVFGAPGQYRILVHYYDHSGWQDETTTAAVSLYRGTTLVASGTKLLFNVDNFPQTGDLWEVSAISIAP